LFYRNRADTGGAVDLYRADVEIQGSVFQANQTTLLKPEGGVGGAISAFSSDHADASTGSGAINRRASRLVVTQSLVQGGGEVARASVLGGCLFAAGDNARVTGTGGVPAAGALARQPGRGALHGTRF